MTESLIYGAHAVAARLQGGQGVVTLHVRSGRLSRRLQGLVDQARSQNCPVVVVDPGNLDTMTNGASHQGVVLAVSGEATSLATSLEEVLAARTRNADGLLLFLDGVTDPGNLGAILRSAATMGVEAVVAPKDNSAPLNADAIKRASGAADHIAYLQVTNLARALKQAKDAGFWVVGTSLDADQPLSGVDCRENIALVMGAEGSGIRRKTAEHCDFLAAIPMVNDAFTLNVSVATGICLYEVVRQRGS